MKKIYTMVLIVFSVLVLGFYVVKIVTAKEKVEVKLEDISGSRVAMGNSKLKSTIYDGILDAYESIISKDKIELKPTDIDAARSGLSEEQFKDKELFRKMRYSELPLHEDSQYRIIINSRSEYNSKSGQVNNNINISYRRKSDDELKNFTVTTPTKYSFIEMINMINENGKLKVIFMGHGQNNNESTLEVCTIDLEKETIKSDKKINTKDIVREDEHIGKSIYSSGKVYVSVSKYDEQNGNETRLLSIDMKDYSIKEYKNNIEKTSLEGLTITDSGCYATNDKIIIYSIHDGEMDINEFDTKTAKFKNYNSIKLDNKAYAIKEEDKESKNLQYNIIGMKDGNIYMEVTIYNNNSNITQKYINIVDLNKNKSVYVGKLDLPKSYIQWRVE